MIDRQVRARAHPADRDGGAANALARRMIAPQLATAAAVPPEGDRWLHEVKHDGFRMIAAAEGERARLWSRGGHDYGKRAPAVVTAVAGLGQDVVLDGELVILRPDGTTDFEALQRALRGSRPRLDLTFMCWDLLRLEGESLLGCQLLERKRRLAALLEGRVGPIRYVDHVIGGGPQVYRLACELGAEGIVSKRVDSIYRPGRRARTWLKVKCWREDVFPIGGYSETATREYPHGTLLLGREDDAGQLHYAGRIGLGYSAAQATAIREALAPARCLASPFTTTPSRSACWTLPLFQARVRYLEITSARQFRHATLKEITGRADGASAASRP